MSVVGIEVKATTNVDEYDFRGLAGLRAATGNRFRRGYVVYQGEHFVPFGRDLWALPISALWQDGPAL